MSQISITKEEKRKLRNRKYLKIKENYELYLLLVIPILFVAVFNYYPMLGVQIAFKKYNAALGIWSSPWTGLYQFKKILTNPKFFQVFRNTLTLSIYQLVITPPITVTFALCLNAVNSKFYKKTVQMLTYMPHFISTVIMVGILVQIFNSRVGLYGNICKMLGIEAVDIWSKPSSFPHLYVWSGIWQGLGWSSIIYLATLSSVDPELYDAASIDGANRFKQLIHIDFPSIVPTLVILLIMKVGHIMSVGYEKVLLMQNSLNLSTSEVISTYSYKVGLQSGTDYSYGAAIGLLNSVINLILLMIVNKISKIVTETSLW